MHPSRKDCVATEMGAGATEVVLLRKKRGGGSFSYVEGGGGGGTKGFGVVFTQ